MSYQVFARKYRPKSFADVLGQDHVVRTLRNAIAQNRLAHAYLFVGPRGTGKTSTARIFAKALNGPGGPKIDFDPEDPICKEIAEGRCLDVREIDGASNNGVEQVRELRDTVNYAPASCRFKIYYIDEVHMLTTAAFNALLKTLEEPPEHVKFIFATTEANKILPTIISRCQRFDLRRIPDPIIANHLLYIAKQEGVVLQEPAAYAIARGADGGMRDAQSMLDQLVAFCGDTIREEDVLQVFGFTAMEAVADLCEAILTRNNIKALRCVHEQSEAGKDLGRFLADLIQHVRTLLVAQSDTSSLTEEMSPEMLQRVTNQAAMATTEQLLRIVDGLAEVDARMRWTSNKRLHLELGIIQAVESVAQVSLTDVITAIDKAGGSLGEANTLVQARRAAAPVVSPQQPRVPVVTAPLDRVPEAQPLPEEPPAAVTPEPEPEPAPEPEPTVAPIMSLRQQIAAAEAAQALVPTPEPEPRAEAAPAEEDEGEIVPIEKLWESILPEIQRERPLLAGWAELGTQLSFARNTLTIGFSNSESFCRDNLVREPTRSFLEGLVTDLLGTRVRLDFIVDETLTAPARIVPEPVLPAEEPTPEAPKPAAAPVPAAETKVEIPVIDNPADHPFYQDKLIDEVIEELDARIVGRTFGTGR